MNMRGFFCLVKHAEAYFVVNLQLKVDYADLSCKYANFFAIYADLFFKHQKGGSPSHIPAHTSFAVAASFRI